MTDVAILYSHASRKIDRSRLYTAGRYYVGVGGEFFTYPLTQQEMELPVFEARTADGLKLQLQVSLNFKVTNNFTTILSIFDHFGHHYDGFISRLAMNIIRDTAANFTAYSYSENRSQISLQMERDIRDDMEELGFTLESVQLLNIQFPANFSSTLSNTLMLQQQVNQARRRKEAEIVIMDGEYAKANKTAEGLKYDARSEANTIRENANADAMALNNTLSQEAVSHRGMIDMFLAQISDNPTEEDKALARKRFVKWFWMNQLAATPAIKNIAVGIPEGLADLP